MKRTTYLFLTVALLTLGLVACQEAPTGQLTQAEQSLTAAQQADAATYAGDELTAADDALAAAKAEVTAQNEKFALFRNYEEANRLIAEAQSKADAAETAAAAGKDEARQEAEASLAAAEAAVDEAEALLAELNGCTPRPKGFAADLAVMQGRVDSLATETQSIQNAIQAEQYSNAKAQAEAFRSQVQPLIDDMSSVKSKLRCRMIS